MHLNLDSNQALSTENTLKFGSPSQALSTENALNEKNFVYEIFCYFCLDF